MQLREISKDLDKFNGKHVQVHVMLADVQLKTAVNKNTFISAKALDATGEMSTLCWFSSLHAALLDANGKTVKISAKVDVFKGKPQLKVETIGTVAALEDLPPEEASKILRVAETSRQDWLDFYSKQVEPLVEEAPIRQVLFHLLEDSAFWQAPAAKGMHHNFRGGLQHHVKRLLQLFVGLVNSDHPSIKGLNKGLVIYGLMAHDFMKTKEYVEKAPGSFDYSKYGNLIGHLAGGAINLQKIISDHNIEISEELYMHMMHMNLAHHAQLAWGSPVTPATAEAWTVHMLDNLDAKLWMCEETEDMQKAPDRSRIVHYNGGK